jgi:hypothetical protein
MKPAKEQRLEAGSADEFLAFTPKESTLVSLRLLLAGPSLSMGAAPSAVI